MFQRLREIERMVGRLADAVDPDRLAGDDAERLLARLTRLERQLASLRLLVARRAADANRHFVHGDRDPARWLARATGTSPGQAKADLETAAQLVAVPEVALAARHGDLSGPQLREVASAAAADPSAAGELLAAAERDGLGELRDRCARIRAGATDETERHRRAHERRDLRHWVDREGAGHLHWRGTPEGLVSITSALDPHRRRLFDEARKQGRREPSGAYGADALVALAESGAEGEPRSLGSRAKVIVLVDHAALTRGHIETGETCEIAGVGPVPVAVVKDMMGDAFLAAVVTDGVDVYSVAHLGRHANARQRTALEVRDRVCAQVGCDRRDGLEIDHVNDWAATHVTRLADLSRFCEHHHDLKTYGGWKVTGPPTHRRLIPPELFPPGELPPTGTDPPEP